MVRKAFPVDGLLMLLPLLQILRSLCHTVPGTGYYIRKGFSETGGMCAATGHFGYKGGRRHRRSDRTGVYAPGVLLPGVAYIYSGNAGYYGICRHIFCHYGPGSNYGVVADGHALQYGGTGPYPYVVAEYDGSGVHRSPVAGSDSVVEGGEHYVVPDKATVADGYASVVLKLAAGVDEYVFADGDILSEVCVERREYAQRCGDRFTEKM